MDHGQAALTAPGGVPYMSTGRSPFGEDSAGRQQALGSTIGNTLGSRADSILLLL